MKKGAWSLRFGKRVSEEHINLSVRASAKMLESTIQSAVTAVSETAAGVRSASSIIRRPRLGRGTGGGKPLHVSRKALFCERKAVANSSGD